MYFNMPGKLVFSIEHETLCVLNEALALKVYVTFISLLVQVYQVHLSKLYILHWIFLTFVLAPPL